MREIGIALFLAFVLSGCAGNGMFKRTGGLHGQAGAFRSDLDFGVRITSKPGRPPQKIKKRYPNITLSCTLKGCSKRTW